MEPQRKRYSPEGNQNNIQRPRNTSLLPLLITAQSVNIGFHQYDIVSGRNSL